MLLAHLLLRQIREYLNLKHAGLSEDPRPAVVQSTGSLQAYHASIAEDSADGQLADSAAWTLADLAAAAQQLAANRDLSTAEAELAAANLALLQGGGSSGAAEEGGSGGGAAQRRHVWYGDPLLSTSETRHSVEVGGGWLDSDGGWLWRWYSACVLRLQATAACLPGWLCMLGGHTCCSDSLAAAPTVLPLLQQSCRSSNGPAAAPIVLPLPQQSCRCSGRAALIKKP